MEMNNDNNILLKSIIIDKLGNIIDYNLLKGKYNQYNVHVVNYLYQYSCNIDDYLYIIDYNSCF
jgi:hypothetical protein